LEAGSVFVNTDEQSKTTIDKTAKLKQSRRSQNVNERKLIMGRYVKYCCLENITNKVYFKK